MFYLGGLPLRAIAQTEQVSENTIKQRLHRGRASLAARLSDRLPGVGNV
jgi:DNA-directed RNA polymerase specialized sigma24 family protein